MTKTLIHSHESMVRRMRGQTMTEYALIMAAIAVEGIRRLPGNGNNLGSLASGADSSLANA